MYLFFIVYEEVLEKEVMAIVEELDIDRYIQWDSVKGKWKEKHMGNHVWPGLYHCILALIEKEKEQEFKKKIDTLRKRFPADEIWLWKLSLKEIF